MTSNLFKIFQSICRSVRDEPRPQGDNKLSDDYLTQLVYLFGDDLINALTLIDDKRIYLVRSDSGRQVFKVLSQDKPIHYICYKNAYYCTCLAFKHKVISSDSIMCKHLIATRIADAMGLIEIENINDQQMADLLK
ncbi:zinc finger SWIM domain-containing protein 7-like [Panonychus citri]|uniref:zinc finger SWIM domain-containing protein 7-like n=1 Tax=Panonychus citri TaxID=50023 RepID=UPI002307F846|nr:zinc finger SWIM domain-containing protein 7-like [Panonychus citri]